MLPPGTVNYYYSIDDVKICINLIEPKIESDKLLHGGLKLLSLQVPESNIMSNIVQFDQPVTSTYLTSMSVIPRPPPVILAGRLKVKTPWDFFKSVFKDYKPDNDKILDDCFEIDWVNTKCEKVIKDDEQIKEVKAYIKSIYKHIREAYKYYAGVAPLGRVNSIGPGTMTEMLNKCEGFIDGKSIKISDVDLQIIACNGGKRITNYLSPDKALIRC